MNGCQSLLGHVHEEWFLSWELSITFVFEKSVVIS